MGRPARRRLCFARRRARAPEPRRRRSRVSVDVYPRSRGDRRCDPPGRKKPRGGSSRPKPTKKLPNPHVVQGTGGHGTEVCSIIFLHGFACTGPAPAPGRDAQNLWGSALAPSRAGVEKQIGDDARLEAELMRESVAAAKHREAQLRGEDLGDLDLDALTALAEQLDVAATRVSTAIASRRSGDPFCCPITCERMVDPARCRVSNKKRVAAPTLIVRGRGERADRPWARVRGRNWSQISAAARAGNVLRRAQL